MSREELLEARERVRRQLEILEAGPALAHDRTPRTPELIAKLKDILDGINEALGEATTDDDASSVELPDDDSATSAA